MLADQLAEQSTKQLLGYFTLDQVVAPTDKQTDITERARSPEKAFLKIHFLYSSVKYGYFFMKTFRILRI